MAKKNPNKIQRPFSDKVLNTITVILLVFVCILVGYPILYVISCSFSDTRAISGGRVFLWPVGFTLDGYKFALTYNKIWIGFRNTIIYTFFGTIVSLAIKILCAYPLSKPYFQGKKQYLSVILLTMLVNPGLIPNFLIKTQVLGLFNNPLVIIISGALGASHVFILRTAFKSNIPGELFDAAEIDGANDFQCLVKLAIPLAKATISVICLYVIIGQWNDYFTAMIYLRNENLYPVQMFMRTILTMNSGFNTSELTTAQQTLAGEGIEQIKYALIVISTIPCLVFYGVVQKYFKKGVMVGSVKG